MSALPARPPGAALAGQPTTAGEQALRQALGYIATAEAPAPAASMSPTGGTSTFGICTRVLLVLESCLPEGTGFPQRRLTERDRRRHRLGGNHSVTESFRT